MRRILTVLFIATATLYFTFLIVSGQTAPDTTAIQPPQLILTTDNNQGILNREAQFVYGPYTCTSNGDPFSPFNTVFTDERPYSYKYRIVIPSDYPDDVLRIELFDPDSINQNITETAVSYTNLAIDNGFSATPEKLPCPNPAEQSQSHACIIKTNEDSLIPTVPGVEPEEINPVWLVRVDENRSGTPAGACGPILDPYNPAYNTPLLFQLYYNRQNNDGPIEEVPLARYTGEVGNGSNDSGDHETDMRWVSPGGVLSSDQSIFVPVDADTPINPATAQPYTFELNIDRDLPNIVVDPITGDRIVHLQVIGLPPGASKNTFAFWAGPDNDVAVIPGDVNSRNLHILNNPGSHNAHGVTILANEALPIQTLSDQGLDMPLIHMGPEYAGETVYLSVFDLDTGSLPPINFYMDTLAYTPDDSADGYDETKTDWAVAHGYVGDPEGGCFDNPYNEECNATWVTYAITLPTDLECDRSSIDDCTPFYGGQFIARIQGGSEDELEYDAFTWSIRSSQTVPEWDNTQSCSAFPIAVDEHIRSVLPPGQSGANQWREDFDYPNPIPDYESFINHVPNVPLLDAREGYLFNISNGASAGGKGWLVWNECIGATANALTDSLTWPGNSKDYNPSGGQCVVNGEPMYRFPGFMEVGDNSDKSMHIGDWVGVNIGSVTSSSVIDALEGHVDLDRILRVVVYDPFDGTGVGGSAAYRMSRFALMRLIGFSMNLGGGESFIMAEFIGWDDSCGQGGQVPLPESVGGKGPGGVGDTDGTTNLALWLQADEDALTDTACTSGSEAGNNNTVACWQDQSGKDNHATEAANGPTLLTAVSNNQPTLYFDGTNYLANSLNLNGRSGFTFFEVAGATTEENYQSILRFQDADDSAVVYPDANQLRLSSDTSIDAGFIPNVLNIGTAVYQLNAPDGMKTFQNGTLVANADTGAAPLPADSLTIGRNNATQSAYTNAGVSELIVFDQGLSSVARILVENYLSAKYDQPIANDKFDGDEPANDNFDMDVAGIGREADSLHTRAASSGMIVVNNTFLRDPGDYLLFGHRTTTNDNSITALPEDGDWDGAPDPQRWTRYWYIEVTDAGANSGSVQIIFDFSDAGMQGLPNGPASNYRLLKREGINDEFSDIATAVSIEDDRIIFEGIDVALLGSNFTLGTLDAGTSPTAVMLETAVVQPQSSAPLIILTLLVLMSLPSLILIRRRVRNH